MRYHEQQKSDSQLVRITYLIFMITKVYGKALLKWNSKAAADKNFANMQTYFRIEYHVLKKVGGLTIEDSSLHLLQQLKTR